MQTERRKFCVAPMLDVTDRHARYFMRKISRRAWLYTEMVTANAIIHGDRDRHLQFDPSEKPVGLQLGGSDPRAMAEAAKIGEQYGYDEININVGCPSDRVQNGQFGACLMEHPEVVAACVEKMREVVDVPVTVKCRLAVDDGDPDEQLESLVSLCQAAGCRIFLVHARKAWLQGLSPKENREVPPLDYDRVHRLKAEHPELEIVINGGIQSLNEAQQHLQHVDGVMLGREVWQNPWVLQQVDALIFNDEPAVDDRFELVKAMRPYVQQQLDQGVFLRHLIRPMIGLFHAQPHARYWRRALSERARLPGAGIEVIDEAINNMIAEKIAS